MDELTTAETNDLLGVHQNPTEDVKPAPKAEDAAEPEEEDEEQSDSDESDSEGEDEEVSEEESADEEEESEEQTLSETAKLTKAIRAERAERKADRERYEASIQQYTQMLNDPDFLAHQYQKIQTEKEQEKVNPKPVQIEIPNAPAYPNTPVGRDRLERDQVRATALLPEVATDDDLRDMVEYKVSKGETYLEAVEAIKRTLGLKSGEFRKEGEKAKEQSIAKKNRMSTETRPRTGTQSSSQVLEKKMQSTNRTTRERATAEALGLI